MKEGKPMFDGDKMSTHVATLAFSNKQFEPQQMKKFMYSVLANAADNESEFTSKGMAVFIAMLANNIYDFDIEIEGFQFNDAHWEIVSRRPVKSKEIAAHCLAMMNHVNDIMCEDEDIYKYCSGIVASTAAFADIFFDEMTEGRCSDVK
jgi:hypothetical protein